MYIPQVIPLVREYDRLTGLQLTMSATARKEFKLSNLKSKVAIAIHLLISTFLLKNNNLTNSGFDDYLLSFAEENPTQKHTEDLELLKSIFILAKQSMIQGTYEKVAYDLLCDESYIHDKMVRGLNVDIVEPTYVRLVSSCGTNGEGYQAVIDYLTTITDNEERFELIKILLKRPDLNPFHFEHLYNQIKTCFFIDDKQLFLRGVLLLINYPHYDNTDLKIKAANLALLSLQDIMKIQNCTALEAFQLYYRNEKVGKSMFVVTKAILISLVKFQSFFVQSQSLKFNNSIKYMFPEQWPYILNNPIQEREDIDARIPKKKEFRLN